MNRSVLPLMILAATLPSGSTAIAREPSIELPAPLARVLTDYEAAWRERDAAALAALFTEDGLVLSSGRPPARGRAAIEQRYAGSGGPLLLRAFEYATQGKIGYIIGGFSRESGEPDLGKFTLTLRREERRWLIVSDMDNSNGSVKNDRPAPPSP